jgi:hypothetical protein
MNIQGMNIQGTQIYDGSIITDNLAIYIDANNSASYSGTGTTITDLSGNGRTQNLSNAAAYTVLSGVKCWNCGTAGNWIRGATSTPQLPTSGFTYIAWARVITSSTGWRTLYRSTPNDHAILVEIGTDRLGMYDNTAAAFFPAGYNVTPIEDVWTQYTVTGNSAGQTFYINGQQVGTTTQTAAGNSHDYFGGIAGQQFGYVANMFLYTSILPQVQIQQNYYGLKSRFGL